MRPSGLEPPTPTMSRWCSNQLSYGRTSCNSTARKLVRPSGLEPPTPTMSRWCSNQLSYGRTSCNSTARKLVRPSGLEPPTPTMSRWCSNQLSYGRIVFLFVSQCWRRGRILTTSLNTGKGKKTFSCHIVCDCRANVHCVVFLGITATVKTKNPTRRKRTFSAWERTEDQRPAFCKIV